MVEQIFTFAWELKNLNHETEQPRFCRQKKQFVACLLNNTKRIAVICEPNGDVPDIITFYLTKCCDGNCKFIRLRTPFRLFADGMETVDKITISDEVKKNCKGGFLIFKLVMDVDYLQLDNHILKINYVPLRRHKEVTVNRLFARTIYNGRWFRKYSTVWGLVKFSEVRQGIILEKSLWFTEGTFILFNVFFSFEVCETGEVVLIQFTRHRDIPWKPMSVNAIITVLDVQGIKSDVWMQDQHLFHFLTPKEVWRFPTFITKATLLRQKNKYILNDELKVKFEFSIQLGTLSSIPKTRHEYSLELIDTTYLDLFTQHMKDLYNTKRFADVLLSASGETIPANKIVLQRRSTKFAEMLDNMNGTDVLDIPDVTMISLKRLLKFLYTDEIYNLEYEDTVVDYVAASKYNILSLKCKYSFALQSHLNIGNVCHILMLADDFGDQLLKNCAMDFIVQYWESVNVSQEWESLSKETQSFAQRIKEILNRK